MMQTMLFLALANDVGAVIWGPSPAPFLIPPAPAPAFSGSPGPAAATLDSCRLSFGIENYDYADLAKKVCDKSSRGEPSLKSVEKQVEDAVTSWKSEKKGKPTSEENQTAMHADLTNHLSNAISDVSDVTQNVTEHVANAVADTINGVTNVSQHIVNTVTNTFTKGVESEDEQDIFGDETLDSVEDTSNETSDESVSFLAIRRLEPADPPAPAEPADEPVLVSCDGTVKDMLREVIKDAIATVLRFHGGMKESDAAAFLATRTAAKGDPKAEEEKQLGFLKQAFDKLPTLPVNTLLRGSTSRQHLPKMPTYAVAGVLNPIASAPASAAVAAPSPASAVPEFDIFVAIDPGSEETNRDGKVVGRGVQVSVTVTAEHDQHIPQILKVVTEAQGSGIVTNILKAKLAEATGVVPRLTQFFVRAKQIEQWSINKCKVHFTKIVKEFSRAYTRRMVPQAIYNECSNFMTRATFSDDLIIDRNDKRRCRKATLKFADKWEADLKRYGAHAFASNWKKEVWLEGDFSDFCKDVCDLKFGEGNPRCSS